MNIYDCLWMVTHIMPFRYSDIFQSDIQEYYQMCCRMHGYMGIGHTFWGQWWPTYPLGWKRGGWEVTFFLFIFICETDSFFLPFDTTRYEEKGEGVPGPWSLVWFFMVTVISGVVFWGLVQMTIHTDSLSKPVWPLQKYCSVLSER